MKVVPGSLPSSGLGRAVARESEAGYSKNSITVCSGSCSARNPGIVACYRYRATFHRRDIRYASPWQCYIVSLRASGAEEAKMAANVSYASE